ncbi:MAG: hypothetical protein B7Z08_12110 [Sphingomonadales bacterium 32-68-7]|nr:MAG: hypothetical protein B7Z33_04130 [Sphingomonadales bacterium 12-68-11]OYX07597.1 MAG: hypothetical protein B7Z08_12110 [Sphingomonadales bacterium 32-68-7]
MAEVRSDRFAIDDLSGLHVDNSQGHGPDLLAEWAGRSGGAGKQRSRVLTRKDLIVQVAQTTGLDRKLTELAVRALLGTIGDALHDGKDVRLTGFGTFSVTERPATLIRNPRTGKPMKVEAAKRPGFRPGKSLKDATARR